MTLLVLQSAEVAELLPVGDCIDVLRAAMSKLSQGEAVVPPRLAAALPQGRGYLGLMPGAMNAPETVGAKVGTLMPGNAAAGRPVIQGVVCLFDAETGAPSAVLDAAAITTLRTAAATGLATGVLARDDALSHGILGTGALVPAHVDAVLAARPRLDRVLIWGRDVRKAQALAAAEMRRTGRDIRAVADAADAAGCDIVTTLTAATAPVLEGRWLRRGTHVNLVGAHRAVDREADSAVVAHARVYVDHLEAALREAGDLLIPIAEGVLERSAIVGEIGQLILGEVAGRPGADAITVYKSLGVVTQDLAAAREIVQRAVRARRGTTVRF